MCTSEGGKEGECALVREGRRGEKERDNKKRCLCVWPQILHSHTSWVQDRAHKKSVVKNEQTLLAKEN